MNKIMVIGSISTDFKVITDKMPKTGETVRGEDFNTSYGGKGANQAVAASRLGSSVTMVGAVGDDMFGKKLINNLESNKINTDYVKTIYDFPSGSAHITLLNNDNSIIFIPGANDKIEISRIEKLTPSIKKMDMVIVQNEIPLKVVRKVIDICHEEKINIIYNPAPADNIEEEYIDKVNYFTPNETEFKVIFPDLTIEEGLRKYPNKMIVTLGSLGVTYSNSNKIIKVPSYKVRVIDTTGAGDSFNGALAHALVNQLPLGRSIKFANLAAAISIGKLGAQNGSPTLDEIKRSDLYEKEWNSE